MVGQTISHYRIIEEPPTTSRKNGTSAKDLADKPSEQVGEGGILRSAKRLLARGLQTSELNADPTLQGRLSVPCVN
jgi:hypothetical protein